MTKEQKDKILKALAEDRNCYARDCQERIEKEYGKIEGADYMLHDNRKIMLNINNIQCIGLVDGMTYIDFGNDIFQVKESYDQIRQMMNEITTIIESDGNKISQVLSDADQDTLIPAA